MPTNKTHKLQTIEDLLRVVSIDNIDGLLLDLRGLLLNALLTKALIDAENPDTEIDLFKGVVVDWTDDNVNRQSLTATQEGGGDESITFRTTGPNPKPPTE